MSDWCHTPVNGLDADAPGATVQHAVLRPGPEDGGSAAGRSGWLPLEPWRIVVVCPAPSAHMSEPPRSVPETPSISQRLSTARSRALVAAALTLVSAVPRFYDLGRLSFYADEDYTWRSAQAVLDGGGSRMPTGMPYRRALPLTWANAAVVAVLGGDGEAPYRVTSAALGTLTPAALFLTGSALVGPPAALAGSAMLALSEWHIAFSRYARMYVPFLFFFILTGHFFWKWGRTGRWSDGVLGLTFFAITVSLQVLGLIAIQFALIAVTLPGSTVTGAAAGMIALAVFAAAAVLYGLDAHFVGRPYVEWSLPPNTEGADAARPPG